MRQQHSRQLQSHGQAQPASTKPIVFFDGECPLCRREIAHYRRIRGSDRLVWIDVTRQPALDTAFGLDQESAMARFHVLDMKGQWQTGAWGFMEMWSHLPGYRWLATILRALNLVPPLDRAYTLFARWRRRKRCSDRACNSPGH